MRGKENEEGGQRDGKAARNKGQQPIRYMDHSRGKTLRGSDGRGEEGREIDIHAKCVTRLGCHRSLPASLLAEKDGIPGFHATFLCIKPRYQLSE